MKIKEIRGICRKYSEPVFRMALSHLAAEGIDHLKSVNVESAAQSILTTGSNGLITPELQVMILKCSCELAQHELWDILAFVQTDIGIYGVTTHPGVIVDFYDTKDCHKKYCTFVMPPNTDEETIEEIADKIRKAKPAYCSDDQVVELIRKTFCKNGIHPSSIGQDFGIEI